MIEWDGNSYMPDKIIMAYDKSHNVVGWVAYDMLGYTEKWKWVYLTPTSATYCSPFRYYTCREAQHDFESIFE